MSFESIDPLRRLFNRVLLGKSKFSFTNKVSKEFLDYANLVEPREYIKSSLISFASKFITETYKDRIRECKLENSMDIEFTLDLLVITPSEFKSIIEAVIEMIPSDTIESIKRGGGIPDKLKLAYQWVDIKDESPKNNGDYFVLMDGNPENPRECRPTVQFFDVKTNKWSGRTEKWLKEIIIN